MDYFKEYGVLGLCLAAIGLFVWKALWPSLMNTVESSRKALEQAVRDASERADRQEQRMERLTSAYETRFAEQSKDFTAALRDTNETHRRHFDELLGLRKTKPKS